ncbi:hypothetical protein GCM10018954_005790 [Kutzneria kofuensis]
MIVELCSWAIVAGFALLSLGMLTLAYMSTYHLCPGDVLLLTRRARARMRRHLRTIRAAPHRARQQVGPTHQITLAPLRSTVPNPAVCAAVKSGPVVPSPRTAAAPVRVPIRRAELRHPE